VQEAGTCMVVASAQSPYKSRVAVKPMHFVSLLQGQHDLLPCLNGFWVDYGQVRDGADPKCNCRYLG